MKKFKTALVTATCVCMLASYGTVFAGGTMTPYGTDQPVQAVPINAPIPVETATPMLWSQATITDIRVPSTSIIGQNPSITIKTTYEPVMEIQLNISGETAIMDNETGLALSVDLLKVGDKISAYYSSAMTKSLPPQSRCFAIVANLVDDHTVGKLMGVGEVTKNDDGSIKFLSKDGSCIMTVEKDAKVSMLDGTGTPGLDNVKTGLDVFVYFDIMALSYPGLASTDKVVIIKPATEESTENIVTIDLKDDGVFDQNGNTMIPLRKVFETLGFTVTWNAENQAVDIISDTIKSSVQIGSDSYAGANDSAVPSQYGAAPTIVNDRTYVPADFLNLIYDSKDAYVFNDGVLTVRIGI